MEFIRMQQIKVSEFSTNLTEALKGVWAFSGSEHSFCLVVRGVGFWHTNGIMSDAVSIAETLPSCFPFYITVTRANGTTRTVRVDGGNLKIELAAGEEAAAVFRLK